jgi:hypothetical protein
LLLLAYITARRRGLLTCEFRPIIDSDNQVVWATFGVIVVREPG